MKNLIFSLISILFVVGTNYGGVKEASNNLTDQHQICVSISIILVTVEYCYSWGDEGDGGSWRTMLEANTKANGDIVTEGANSYLVIHGFNDQLSGVKVNGGKYDMPNGYETVPGTYKISNGDLKVLLKRK